MLYASPMAPNPYAAALGDNDPATVLATTPAKLKALVAGLSAEQVNTSPAPGKWSIREIFAHLADCEIAFGFRLRQTLAVDNPELQPFDQDKWAEHYAAYDYATAVAFYEAFRDWNLKFLSTVTDEQKQRGASHPERGFTPFSVQLATIAGHDLHHVSHMEKLVASLKS
jgi:uncharacterized damage-inducible protein DinB